MSGDADGNDQEGSARAPGAPERRHIHVLLVEDEEGCRELTVMQLEEMGYSIDAVASGKEALEAVARFPYSIVLMDCRMPGLDGLETTAEIRRTEPKKRRVPIVAVTAYADKGKREACLRAGMDDLFEKPVGVRNLGEVIELWNTALDPSRLEMIRGVAGGRGRALARKFVALYLESAPAAIRSIREIAEDADAAALESAVHEFKNTSANIGARAMSVLCARIEHWARSGDVKAAAGLFDGLDVEFERVKGALETERAKDPGQWRADDEDPVTG